MNKEKINLGRFFKIITKLTGLWLFVIFWWGLMILAPLQIHNQVVLRCLPYIAVAAFLFIIIGYWQDQSSVSLTDDEEYIIPLAVTRKSPSTPKHAQNRWKTSVIFLILVIFLGLAAICLQRNITLIFILTSCAIIIIGELIGLKIITRTGNLLLITSFGFLITQAVLILTRGNPLFASKALALHLSFILNLFGNATKALSGTLLLQGKKVTCDLIKTGFFPSLAFCLGLIAYILITPASVMKKTALIIIGILFHYLYFIARAAVVAIMLPGITFAGPVPFNLLYWKTVIYSFIPLIPLWSILIYESDLGEPCTIIQDFAPGRSKTSTFLIYGFITAFVLLLTVNLKFYGFTDHKQIHIIIDEIHSEWESTLIDFNQNIYGTLAENSYHCFLDYITHFYPTTIITNKNLPEPPVKNLQLIRMPSITQNLVESLQNEYPKRQSIIILKCITTPFSSEEIQILKNFVENGGSLFLIGDHTDVFFMNKNLNQLSEYFGIRFEQNSVYFVDGGWVITEPQYHKNHPTTQYIKRFIWATGDSIAISDPAFPLIYTSHLCFADEVNYFLDNFFGNTRIDSDEKFGSYCIMAGANYGKGRIVAFTDSTCFNNYLMFSVGRREMLAGVFTWLAARGKKNHIFPFLAFITFCFAGVVIIIQWPGKKHFFSLLIIGSLTGWFLGTSIALCLNGIIYPKPEPICFLPEKILIDSNHKPLHALSYGNSENFLSPESYDTLLFNIGRMDIFPKIFYTGILTEQQLNNISVLIIASPQKGYHKKEKESIENFVRNGGALILIEGANKNSTVNQIATLFDINFRLDISRQSVKGIQKTLIANKLGNLKINPTWVDGTEVLFQHEQMPIIGYKPYGKGLILALGDDGLFMKINTSVYEMQLTAFQCNIIKALLEKDEEMLKSINWDYMKGM